MNKEQVTNEHLVAALLKAVGDDPSRPGLLETPERVVRSWEELFCGYGKDPAEIFKTFDPEGTGPGQIVILRNIEFYSTCEHHMIPFLGLANIAYIPDQKVIGISKLARLLEIFTRRLQIQERIGQQVTDALMKHLAPKGAACILQARHLCISGRGIQKQHSDMVTSSLTGCFLEESSARSELMQLLQLNQL